MPAFRSFLRDLVISIVLCSANLALAAEEEVFDLFCKSLPAFFRAAPPSSCPPQRRTPKRYTPHLQQTSGSNQAGLENMNSSDLEYVGFWPRVGATLIDLALIYMCILPPLYAIYGAAYWSSNALVQGPADFLLTGVLPTVATILLWAWKQATPGKMAMGAKIVDAVTGGAPTTTQLMWRYAAYFLAMLPLGLGLLWVAFDDRKQGWHDKLSGTVVVRPKNRHRDVSFD